MKKTLLILFLAVASLTACKKDEESSNKLEGTWDLTSSYHLEKTDGVVVSEMTYPEPAGAEHLVFDGNKITLYKDGEVEGLGTFSNNENTITIQFEGETSETYPLRWKSSNEFVITYEDIYTFNGKNYQDKEERTYKKR